MASISRRADGQWRARHRDPAGKEHARHFARKIDAQHWLDSVTTAVRTGAYVDPNAGRLSVGEWAPQWLAAQAHLRPTTRSRYQGILNTHVLPSWGQVRLSDVTNAQVQGWVAQLGARGLAPATVRKTFRVLSLVFALAVKDGRLARNPCTGANLPRPAPARRRYLSHAQVAQLADATRERRLGTRAPLAERDAAASYRLVVLVLAYCGLRWGELAALRVSSLDLLRRRIQITESVVEVDGVLTWGAPKAHERRSVPVPAFLADELAAHVAGRARDELVFTGVRGGGVLRNRVFRHAAFDRAATATGLTGLARTPCGTPRRASR